MTNTNFKFAIIAAAASFAFGCEPDNASVAAQNTPILADPQVDTDYQFVEHPAAERLMQTRFADRCSTGCAVQWQLAFDNCMTLNAVQADSDACRSVAHEHVAVCMEVHCAPRINAEASPACAVTCDAEAQEVISECTGTQGYSLSCLTAGDATYQLCFEDQCGQATPYRGSRSAVQDIAAAVEAPVLPETPTAGAAADEPMTCNAMCEAADLKAYVGCLQSTSNDVDRCRDETGDTFHDCIATHCPEEL